MTKRSRTLFAIYFAYFLDYFGYAIVFGLFGPLVLSSDFNMFSAETPLHMRHLLLGILFAVYPLMQLLFAPISGDVADHLGRKKTFFILGLGVMVGYFLSGVAIDSRSFPLLLISRVITGIFSSNRTICMASLSDIFKDEKSRSKAYGTIATLGGLSWIVSIGIGGLFSKMLSPEIPFWITTALAFLFLLTIRFLFSETIEKRESFSFDPLKGVKNITSCFKIEGLGRLYLYYFVMMLGWGINLLWLNPYTISKYRVSEEMLFGLLASTGITWSLGSSLINQSLIKRHHTKKVALIGTVGLMVLFLLCSIVNSFIPFAIFALLASIFGALAWTNALSTISLSAPEKIQGKVMGISQSFASVAFMIAPLIAGLVAGLNIVYVYPMAALLISISFLILKFSPKKRVSTVRVEFKQEEDLENDAEIEEPFSKHEMSRYELQQELFDRVMRMSDK